MHIDIEAREEPAPRRAVNPDDAVTGFVAWMRAFGTDFAGRWWPAEDIAGFWAWYCAEAGIEEAHPDDMRARLSKLPGVLAERSRIAGPQFDDLRRYLARLTSRGERTRLVVYRIATAAEMAAADATSAAAARSARAQPGPALAKLAARNTASKSPAPPQRVLRRAA
jgi:hypothetical protein